MKSEKINFFEDNLLFIVQSDNGQAVSFRLDTQKLLKLFVSVLFLFILLLSGTLLFFKERKANQVLSQNTLLNQLALVPINSSNSESSLPLTTKPNVQDFSGNCILENCFANLTLMAQEATQVEGSLLILLETISPQIGSGNPTAQNRQKYYAYPSQSLKEELTQDEIFSLDSKPFLFSRSLTSKAEFKIGKFQRPIAFHLYLFNNNRELIKHETLPIVREGKNDP